MIKDVIVISKNKRLSVFSTFKKACDAFGWGDDYNKMRSMPMPFEYKGCTIQRVPFGVSIKCFELLDAISTKAAVQQWTKDGGIYQVSIHLYDKSYELEVEYETKHEPADYHNGDRGSEQISPAYDYDVPTAIISAEEATEDGPKKIVLDKWTEEQVLNHINLGE